MLKKDKKIFLAGHKGLVGSAILRILKKKNYKNILTVNRAKLDLRDQAKVKKFFNNNKIDSVIVAAAKVGGIKANNLFGADFIYDNLQIQNNLIHQSYKSGVKDLIFLGSSCIYPKFAKQPMMENSLLTSTLEETNEAYAVAKIAGVKMCQYYNSQYNTNYKSLMPCNTFGPNDNYDLDNSHFLPALIRKVYEAKTNKKNYIKIWGNGKTKREVIYVDDLAEAVIYFLFKKTKYSLINIGTQKELSIIDYANLIMKQFKTNLKIKYINRHLTGTPRKVMNCQLSRKLGWKANISINEGVRRTIEDFKKKHKNYL